MQTAREKYRKAFGLEPPNKELAAKALDSALEIV